MKVLILGSTGMLGHMVLMVLQERNYQVNHISRYPFKDSLVMDVRCIDKLKLHLYENSYDVIVNCVGLLNENAENNPTEAILINSVLPRALVDITKNSKTRVIHISTDCVFSGDNGPYYIDSKPDGDSIYSRTKALGELNNSKDLTIRTSIIGPDLKTNGIGLLNWFLNAPEKINGYSEVYWSGLTTLELANFIAWCIKNPLTGIFHGTNNIAISKFELLNHLNIIFFEGKKSIVPYYQLRSNKVLINNKHIDYEFPSYRDMLSDLSVWIKKHKDLYTHYKI